MMALVEALHYASLAPLLFLLVFRRDAGAVYWLVAFGFAVSFFMDLTDSWAVSYVLPSIQLGLFAWAFGQPWVMALLVALASFQVVGTELDRPDVAVTLAGSMAAIYLARDHPLAWSMLAYCGLGTAFYLLMVENLWAERFMTWWYGYQGSRLLAFGLFGRAAWKT